MGSWVEAEKVEILGMNRIIFPSYQVLLYCPKWNDLWSSRSTSTILLEFVLSWEYLKVPFFPFLDSVHSYLAKAVIPSQQSYVIIKFEALEDFVKLVVFTFPCKYLHQSETSSCQGNHHVSSRFHRALPPPSFLA